MLSIIICSLNSQFLSDVSNNIKETIGVEYELLPFNNLVPNLGICEVYNRQAKLAQYSYLLFLHEDVIFETKNWGQLLINIFRTTVNCGLIGLAGSNYKSRMYSGWYTHIPEMDACNIIHRTNGKELSLVHHRPKKSNLYEVVCLDGVFIASTREAWLETTFNQDNLKGFHFYDLDFSIRASFKYKVYVTMDIDVNHITKGGDFGDKWVEQAFIFHEYSKTYLPHPKANGVNKKLELLIARKWLDRLKDQKILLANKIKWINNQHLYSFPVLYYEIAKFLLYYPFALKHLHLLLKKIKGTSKKK